MSTIVSTGFILPQSVIANGQATGNPFLNPNDILFADDLFAQGDNTADIIVGNFQFNIPSDAIITGVEFKVKGKRGQQITPPVTLTFYAVDNTSGTDVFYPYIAPFTGLTLSNVVHSFGTSSYLFATSFTADQANNLKLQIVSDGQVFIDDVLVNVYYYVPTPVVPIPPNALGCPDCNSPIQVQAMYLDLPFISGETKFYLKAGSWQYPDGTPVQPGDVGACGGEVVFVFDEGKPKSDGQNFEENVILDISSGFWTVLPSGVIEFDIGAVTNRGRQFHTPYGHDATLMSDHSANSKVIVSNSGLFYSRFVRRCEVDITFSPPIVVEYGDVSVVNPAHTFNFLGAVSVTQNPGDPYQADILIPGVGTLPPVLVDVVSGTSGDVQVLDLTLPDLTISGINRGALVQIITEQLATVVSVVGNGTEIFAQLISVTDAPNNLRTEQWFIVAPLAGLMSIEITLSQAAYISAGAESWSSINQATPTGTVSSATGTSNMPADVNLTTNDNSVVVDSLGTETLPILYTQGLNQVLNWVQTVNPIVRQGGSSYQLAGTAPDNVVMKWVTTQNCPFVMTTVELNGITQTIPVSPDIFVKATAADTTASYLDNKIEILPGSLNVTVVKTIINPGGNEMIRYTIDTSGGSGTGNNLVIDQTPLGVGSTYNLLAGTINGTNTTFTVDAGLYITGTLMVFLNGVELQQGSASDWEETDPANGVFDFIVAPIPGDIITVQYQTTNGTFGAQAGIQWQNEGVNLGTPGTVNEVDFVGANVNAIRAGDKVTVTVSGSGGGGLGGGGFLGIAQRIQTGASSFTGDVPNDNNIVMDSSTSRVYVPLFVPASGSADAKNGVTLRIFKNDFGSYYQENEINYQSALTQQPANVTGQQWYWMNDGTQLIAIVEIFYNPNSSPTVQTYRVDLIKVDYDGTVTASINLFTQTPLNGFPKQYMGWSVTRSGADGGGGMVVNDGTSFFIPWRQENSNVNNNENNYYREYDIATGTLQNTYNVANGDIPNSGVNSAISIIDPLTGYYYWGNPFNDNSITRWEISGANFIPVSGSIDYPWLAYYSTTNSYALGAIKDITSTSYTLDVVNFDVDRGYTGANQLINTTYKVQSLIIPKF